MASNQLHGHHHVCGTCRVPLQGALNHDKCALFYRDTISHTNCHHSGSSVIITVGQVYSGLSWVSVNFKPFYSFITFCLKISWKGCVSHSAKTCIPSPFSKFPHHSQDTSYLTVPFYYFWNDDTLTKIHEYSWAEYWRNCTFLTY